MVQENSESKAIKLFRLNLKAKTMERIHAIPIFKMPVESQRILSDGRQKGSFSILELQSDSFIVVGTNSISYCKITANSILVHASRSFCFNDIVE